MDNDTNKYNDDDILSTIDVSKILNVSRTTINYWVRHYLLPCEKTPGGRYKIRYLDLKKFLALHNKSNRSKLKRQVSKYKVAIIDPNVETKKNYTLWLSNDYEVKSINNIESPMKELSNFLPDIIIIETDLKSTKINGLNVLAQINENLDLKSKLVFFISNKYDEDDVVKALENGACEYIRKPVGQTELKVRIKSILRYFIDI